MLWMGMYVVVVFLVCFLVMVVDVFYGFWIKKLWFLLKYFVINVIFLLLLVVVMKLFIDFMICMWVGIDSFVKVSSLIFLLIVMGNFMMFLGFMNDKDILLNVIVLVIFVIMVIVNVCI